MVFNFTCLACCVCVPKSHGANSLCSSCHRQRQRWFRPAYPKASIVLGLFSQPAHVETPRQVRVHAAASAEAAEKSGGGQGEPVGFHFLSFGLDSCNAPSVVSASRRSSCPTGRRSSGRRSSSTPTGPGCASSPSLCPRLVELWPARR